MASDTLSAGVTSAAVPSDMVWTRVNRMLALVDIANAIPKDDVYPPGPGESSDSCEKLSAVLHCLSGELQALHAEVSHG